MSGPSLKARALRLLAQREHSRAELAVKLKRQLQAAGLRQAQRRAQGLALTEGKAPDHDAGEDTHDPPAGAPLAAALAAQIEAVLDELQRQGLLSDERTAASLLAVRAPRHGERRLRHDLQAKGLDPALIAQTLAQARDSEEPRALALWQRRFGEIAADAGSHAKQVRFLAGRGFTMDTITRVLRQARAEVQDRGADPDPDSAAGAGTDDQDHGHGHGHAGNHCQPVARTANPCKHPDAGAD